MAVEGPGGRVRDTQAARRALAEARRAEQEAARRAEEAERRRKQLLAHEARLDRLETRPGPNLFAASPVTSDPVQVATPSTYRVDQSGNLVPEAAPSTLPVRDRWWEDTAPSGPDGPASPSPFTTKLTDEQELALLAHRLGEAGKSPEEVQERVVEVRLSQIARQQAALAGLDTEKMLSEAQASEAAAQAALDHYIKSIDSIYSGLAPLDRKTAAFLAWGPVAEARQATYQALALQVKAAELSLEQAVLARQAALEAGLSEAVIASYDAKIAEAQKLLDGDPAAGELIAQLEQDKFLLEQQWRDRAVSPEVDPHAPDHTLDDISAEAAQIDAQIAQLELDQRGLLARLSEADQASKEAWSELETAQTELEQELASYQGAIEQGLPEWSQKIEEIRTLPGVAELPEAERQELDASLQHLVEILPTATPEELAAALEAIRAFDYDGRNQGEILALTLDNILFTDPRILIASAREEAQSKTAFGAFAEQLMLNVVFLGIPSFIENQRILNAPGASPGLVAEARFGLAMDYLGFALNLLGPAVKGLQTVIKGGRQVVNFTPETVQALRTAGYGDDAIAEMAARLSSVATSSRQLNALLLQSSPEETQVMLDLMRGGMTLEKTVTTVGGMKTVVQRPMEVVEFLLRSDPEAVRGFWTLVHEGRSLDEARTIMTLVRNGKPLDEITAALRAGRPLDEIVKAHLFETLSVEQAAAKAGIPAEFLGSEAIPKLLQENGYDMILLREANPGLAATWESRVPKMPVDLEWMGQEFHVSSVEQEIGGVTYRFKTNDQVLVELQQRVGGAWQPSGKVVALVDGKWTLIDDARAQEIIAKAATGAPDPDVWLMGGDIDVLAVVKDGRILDSDSLEEIDARVLLDELMPAPLESDATGLVTHGSAQPYAGSVRPWGPGLAITPQGELVYLANADAVELFLKTAGAAGEPYAQYSELIASIASMPVPSSSASYLAGTVAANLPEATATGEDR